MKDGESIRFSGEGDQKTGFEPGDMIVVLNEASHDTFHHHDDNDLLMEMSIDLVEALCGFRRTIDTLDQRVLLLTNLPGKFR